MIFFIVVLRALAACLITNSHYTGIYPTDIIANGGLLGDILFFAVSGYCLANTKKSFPRYYGKRIAKLYPPVLLITVVYFILGAYKFSKGQNFIYWFIWPTSYHFVGSILLLYIPFYFVGKYDCLKRNIPWIMLSTGVIYAVVYAFVYDKSYYHIDTVREPMIWFLFFASMLLGGYFRYKDEKYRNQFRWWNLLLTILFLIGYFCTKIFLSSGKASNWQFVNQISIFALLYFLFATFSGLDGKLEKMPKWIKTCIMFLSKMTLEIYVVQSVIIAWIRPYLSFPFNWIVITACILIAAFVLHMACVYLEKGVLLCVKEIREKVKKEEE